MPTDFFKVNGVKVANIHNNSENVLFGIGVRAGSNYETPEIAGISHFSEHMFFKGTKKRNWRDINREFAKLGADNNAYTNNSEVFYHTTCPKENIEFVIELMLDMLFNLTVPEDEFEKERNVIIEEKKMYDDDPYYAFNSIIDTNVFEWEKGHHILGTFETLKSITRDDLIGFLKNKINLENILFVCCGDIKTKDLKSYIEKYIPEKHDYLEDGAENMVNHNLFRNDINYDNKFQLVHERDNIVQSQISMLIPGYSILDSKSDADSVILSALGGGMFSLLSSKLREELGLCYSVYMHNLARSYPDLTTTILHAYTSPENIDKFMEESKKIFANIVKNGIGKDLFDCAKINMLGNILRMTETSIGKALYLFRRYLFTDSEKTFEDFIKEIKAVTIKDCNDIIEEIFSFKQIWAVMNPK